MTNTQLIDIFDLIVPHETTLFNEEETIEGEITSKKDEKN